MSFYTADEREAMPVMPAELTEDESGTATDTGIRCGTCGDRARFVAEAAFFEIYAGTDRHLPAAKLARPLCWRCSRAWLNPWVDLCEIEDHAMSRTQ